MLWRTENPVPKPARKFPERICKASVIWFEASSVELVLDFVGWYFKGMGCKISSFMFGFHWTILLNLPLPLAELTLEEKFLFHFHFANFVEIKVEVHKLETMLKKFGSTLILQDFKWKDAHFSKMYTRRWRKYF